MFPVQMLVYSGLELKNFNTVTSVIVLKAETAIFWLPGIFRLWMQFSPIYFCFANSFLTGDPCKSQRILKKTFLRIFVFATEEITEKRRKDRERGGGKIKIKRNVKKCLRLIVFRKLNLF